MTAPTAGRAASSLAPHLEIYVDASCRVCDRAHDLAQRMRVEFPAARIDVIDVSEHRGWYRDLIIASPTYVLRGLLYSLGNPAPAELRAALARLVAGVSL